MKRTLSARVAELACTLGLLVGAVGACHDGASLAREEAAIRAAIGDYLLEERGIDPDLMRMELAEVQIQGDQAMVLVRFSSSQAPEGLEFEYELERSGEGWKVASSRSQGTHGGGTMPDDHPPDGLEAPDGTP